MLFAAGSTNTEKNMIVEMKKQEVGMRRLSVEQVEKKGFSPRKKTPKSPRGKSPKTPKTPKGRSLVLSAKKKR